MDELETCKRLALEAGKRIMELYSLHVEAGVKVDPDGRTSPVTEADLEADRIIMSGLRKAFPDHGFLTEEEKDTPLRLEKKFVFIVDPLDGTKEFLKRNGEFTVNIGLVRDGVPVLGVVYAPVLGELYYACDGAYLEKDGKKVRLTVTDTDSLSSMRAVVSRSHGSEKRLRLLVESAGFASTVPSGSSLKGCLLAAGEADVYPRFGPQHEWDICAMHAIIRLAGGRMTRLDGSEIKYNRPDTIVDGFLASNGRAHEEILKLAREI